MGLGGRLYDLAGERIQATLDRLRYALGALPRVGKQQIRGSLAANLYPPPFKACLIISADLELAWAWRYAKAASDPLSYAIHRAEQARRNVPKLLALLDRYEIPITWGAVGHLFLERCDRINGRMHPNLPRPPYFENEHWRYASGDWFDADPGSNYLDAPAWYAPDIIRVILRAKVRHEIACHTFSHLDLSEGICPQEVADADLSLCQQIACEWGLPLRSLVFPADRLGNLTVLQRHGIRAYRLWTGHELDWPRRDAYDLWQIPGGKCLEKPSNHWKDKQWLTMLCKHVDRAIETGTVCSFWFHPSCHPVNVEHILPGLLEYVNTRRSEVWVTTMDKLMEWFDQKGQEKLSRI